MGPGQTNRGTKFRNVSRSKVLSVISGDAEGGKKWMSGTVTGRLGEEGRRGICKESDKEGNETRGKEGKVWLLESEKK